MDYTQKDNAGFYNSRIKAREVVKSFTHHQKMKIDAKTEERHHAAYSAQSALPCKLKSILKVIDGQTRTHVYKNNLNSFGDIDALLRSLEIAGLLRVIT